MRGSLTLAPISVLAEGTPQGVSEKIIIHLDNKLNLSPDDVIHQERPVCWYTGYQHCSNLQAPKHYLIRAANYLLAQNGSKNSNIVVSRTGVQLSSFALFVSLCFMVRYPIPERFLISDTLKCCEENFFTNIFPIKFQFGIKLILYLRSKVLDTLRLQISKCINFSEFSE